MKRCPACGTTYTDASLRFCLSDGAELVSSGSDEATVVRSQAPQNDTIAMGSGRQMRVDIPQPTGNVPPAGYQATVDSPRSSGGIFKVIVVVLLVGLFALVVVFAAGTFIYFRMNTQDRASADTNKETRITTPVPSPSKDDKDELRDQIANLEKMLNDQKKTNQPANIPLTLPNQPTTTTTARVNSPGDGFLALRTYPDSELGERILKIPHGSVITVGACTAARTIPGRKAGRWCRANYNGYTGWVFDAYLIY